MADALQPKNPATVRVTITDDDTMDVLRSLTVAIHVPTDPEERSEKLASVAQEIVDYFPDTHGWKEA